MTELLHPELDLVIARVIKAPRATIWSAWTDPARFEQWWVPAPAKCRVEKMDLHAGGAFVTRISENRGVFEPHLDACFLAIEEGRRIVFTNALVGGWRPAEKGFMTAVITLRDHPLGTEYSSHVMHKDKADRDEHERMGFQDGWGCVIAQLAALVEPRG